MTPRAALAADCAALAALDARCNPSAWSARQFADALAQPCNTVLLCGRNGTTAAFIVWQTVAGESELHLLAVAPEYRRQGIAARLLDRWLQTAAGRFLLEVRAGNAAALSLYRRAGFTECGRRKDYYTASTGREDAVLMEKLC